MILIPVVNAKFGRKCDVVGVYAFHFEFSTLRSLLPVQRVKTDILLSFWRSLSTSRNFRPFNIQALQHPASEYKMPCLEAISQRSHGSSAVRGERDPL